MIETTIHQINKDSPVTGLTIEVTTSSIPGFNELVRRALNCWPDAPPELKGFGDLLMHGKVLQDYYATRTDLKKNKTTEVKV